MTITKKHLKELADIVHMAQYQAQQGIEQELATHLLTQEIKSFAKRDAPNFDESRWNDYMHKKDEEILKKVGWLK